MMVISGVCLRSQADGLGRLTLIFTFLHHHRVAGTWQLHMFDVRRAVAWSVPMPMPPRARG